MICYRFWRLCVLTKLRNSYSFIITQNNVITTPQIRLRTAWLHRRPVRVITPVTSQDQRNTDLNKLKTEREAVLSSKVDEHEIIELDSHFINASNNSKKQTDKSGSIKTTEDASTKEDLSLKEMPPLPRSKLPVVHNKTKEEKEITKRMKMERSAFKTGVPLFTKLEDADSKLSQVMLIAKSRNKREKKKVILLEGKRLIRDAIAAGHTPHMIFFSRVEDLKDLQVPNGVEVYKTTYKRLSMWSDVVTSPGVMGLQPGQDECKLQCFEDFHHLRLLGNCTSRKVCIHLDLAGGLRTISGVFKTPAVENKELSKDALPLTVVCDNVRDPGNMGSILRLAAGVGCSKIVLTKGCVDLWEPKVLRAAAGAHFRLPIVKDLDWNDVDSHIKNESFVLLADSNTDKTENIMQPVPVVPYYAMDYSDLDAITLIIGGETEGLSLCSFKLASACNGVRINVPLCNSVNSLNTGTALGIIMFEIKRQICLSQQNNRVELCNP